MAIEKKPDGLVFASSAKLGEVVQFPDIGRGWGISFEQTNGIPSMEHFNHLFNRIDSSLVYILQQGIPEWNENIDYPKGAIVKHGENTYKALSSNKNKEVSLSQYWIDTDSSFNVIRDMLVGAPIPYPLSTVPTGCLAMNGQRFDKSRYPKLALIYPSGTLPDMRGEFIRGLDNGRNVDVARGLLTYQADALQDHVHFIPTVGGDSYEWESDINVFIWDNTNNKTTEGAFVHKSAMPSGKQGNNHSIKEGGDVRTYHASKLPSTVASRFGQRVANETRPRNIAYNYICLAE